MKNINFDWEDVENKIGIICYKFENLKPWHEDLAQELRIHAYYISNNYWDLYRKAIDFWRKLQTKQAPEIPYFDLEVLDKFSKEDEGYDEFDRTLSLITSELNRPGYNKCDENMLELSRTLLKIIVEDIDPRKETHLLRDMKKTNMNHYVNERLNLSWVAEELGIGYKRVVAAMKFIEDTVRGLAAMHKIEIPIEYFQGYYD